ncbi:diguanylate cyclase [Sulfurimonas sp. C5]|uniref:GGDEF domain-containing protein n=1 Tax=Sulfurimonas sp. C5 TaxID=3036947 RepID=UPI0024546237|nr:diguanylate cyclase [Sulfurimonas sp. C5]MDH4945028.1 diguanylate cyclase [Sulfurimonas sp. C5]
MQYNLEHYITISIGISQLEKNDTFKEFFKRADQALYYAKENGRNQVSVIY